MLTLVDMTLDSLLYLAGVLYAYRGDAYCCLCDFRSATTNYLKARRLLPDNAIIRERLARLLFCTARQDIAEGQVAEAIPLLSEARSLAPSDSLYWVRPLPHLLYFLSFFGFTLFRSICIQARNSSSC